MPEFKEEEEARLRRKNEELAPYVEAAFKRKEYMPGRRRARSRPTRRTATTSPRSTLSKLPEGQRQRVAEMRKMREVAAKA